MRTEHSVEISSHVSEVGPDSIRYAFFLTGKLLRLLELFQAAEIPVIPLKGPVLAQILYGDPVLREFEDLDLLVRKRDVLRALQLLNAHGYAVDSSLSWAPIETLIGMNCELTLRRECGTP